MIVQRLKQTSTNSHLELEARLSFLLDRNLTFNAYRNLLIMLFGFYSPLEEMFESLGKIPFLSVNDLKARKKLPLLQKDLVVSSFSIEDLNFLPICHDLPLVSSPFQVLGCMYVLEGATLGGQIILKHLKLSLNLDENCGAAFFNSYGRAVGPMWKSFTQILEDNCSNEQSQKVITEAANDTFTKLDKWLSNLR